MCGGVVTLVVVFWCRRSGCKVVVVLWLSRPWSGCGCGRSEREFSMRAERKGSGV